MSDNISDKKDIWIKVNKSMVKKVTPVIKEGDIIYVVHDPKLNIFRNEYCFVSHNEKQWIEKFWPGLRKRYRNIYAIRRIVMMS